MAYEPKKQRAVEGPRESWRITLAWNGTQLEMRRADRVMMIAPAASKHDPEEGSVGFWVEVRDRKQQRLYHRVLHDPIRTRVEVFSRERIELRPVNPEPTEFDVVVPAYSEGSELVVWSSPLEFKRAHEPAQIIGRFDLKTGRREEGRAR